METLSLILYLLNQTNLNIPGTSCDLHDKIDYILNQLKIFLQ